MAEWAAVVPQPHARNGGFAMRIRSALTWGPPHMETRARDRQQVFVGTLVATVLHFALLYLPLIPSPRAGSLRDKVHCVRYVRILAGLPKLLTAAERPKSTIQG